MSFKMKALYLRYCVGKIIDDGGKYVFIGLNNKLSNFPVASRTAGYLTCAKTYPLVTCCYSLGVCK